MLCYRGRIPSSECRMQRASTWTPVFLSCPQAVFWSRTTMLRTMSNDQAATPPVRKITAAGLWFAVLTVVATIVAAGVTGYFTSKAATDAIKAQNQSSTRSVRNTYYRAFLAAANGYALSTVSEDAICKSAPCPVSSSYMTANSTFQGAINDIYLYGDRKAVLASEAVAGALPPSLATFGNPYVIAPFDAGKFDSAFVQFLDIACTEIGTDIGHCSMNQTRIRG